MAILEAGTIAPDFSLQVSPDQRLSLTELRGEPVVLAFYPAGWRRERDSNPSLR